MVNAGIVPHVGGGRFGAHNLPIELFSLVANRLKAGELQEVVEISFCGRSRNALREDEPARRTAKIPHTSFPMS